MNCASMAETMPIVTPDHSPPTAVNTNSTQFTSEPVTSWLTEKGPTMTAPAGKTLPSSWATMMSAMPIAVRATH